MLGRGERIDILNAALLNGISSHVFDFDDTHLKTIIHPAGPVASAILALSEYRPVSGTDFLNAFILGVEVECRIGNAVYPAHYDVGWHITGTAGVFGAAAAAGNLLGLDEQKMIWALGIAGTQSSGFREMFGTMCKSFHPGRAAQNGLSAALLADRGFTSSDRVLEAPRGFAHVMSTKRDFDEITGGLGEGYEIALNTYKPFACGIVIHPSIDGCIQLRNEHRLKAHDVASIELDVHPLVLELTGKKTPRTGLEGKFSVYHSAAVAIIHGAAGDMNTRTSRLRISGSSHCGIVSRRPPMLHPRGRGHRPPDDTRRQSVGKACRACDRQPGPSDEQHRLTKIPWPGHRCDGVVGDQQEQI